MALIPLYEAKTYLRVDSSDEDALVGILLASATQMCVDVARLTTDQWKAIDALACDEEGNVLPTDTDLYTEDELSRLRSIMRVAILYALGYLYEHREEADHHALMLTLRSLLFAVREGVV
jgi:3-methyladenine DNA glycosylase AlkD